MHTRIRYARERIGLSRADVAKAVAVTTTSCISWELPPGNRNATHPNVDNLSSLAVTLGVRFEWLATGRGSPDLDGTADSDPPGYGPERETMPDDQRELLQAFAALPARKRRSLLHLLDSLPLP
jgi:DNA-binding XRE family transcriptional regulator